MVEIRALRVRRGGTEILHGIDTRFAPGRVTALVGPSGGGKTTLLRCIVGTQRITSGSVTVDGRPAGSPALRRVIGYASQQASVYDDLTVTENLRYFATAIGTDRAETERVLAVVDLVPHAHRLVDRLSGGERSRVSLAVALLGRPRLLVLDEPTVGLDPVLREQLWSLFHRLAVGGTTLLVSTHVMDEARRADDLVLLRDGDVLVRSTPHQVLRDTGADDLDGAFLRLVRGAGNGADDADGAADDAGSDPT
ncbi:MAG: ABC transporter ATP-binding protein [Jatrophihabitans sp.]|uniref:ABC transporter ATP-binding protein n=1 Tax=Jatrophihabitans sp. TaxID=1932789 RepID=UPI003F7E8F8A